jgi:AcrR family transcriptional regulator
MGIAERREREKERRRSRILSAAEKVFFSKGYSGATMDEIAHEAELSKGTLYLYFKGKDEVHKAIVSAGMKRLLDLIERGVVAGSCGMARAEVIWDTFMCFSREHADYCDAIIHYETKAMEVDTDEEMTEWLRRYKVIGFTVRAMEQGIADGSIRQDMDPAALTLLFWAQMMGAIQLVTFKKALIWNLLKMQADDFLGLLRRFVFEQLSPRRLPSG